MEIGTVFARIEELVELFQAPLLYENQRLFLYRFAPQIGLFAIEAEDLTDHAQGVDKKRALLDLVQKGPCPFAIWVDKYTPHTFAAHDAYFSELFKAFEVHIFSERFPNPAP